MTKKTVGTRPRTRRGPRLSRPGSSTAWIAAWAVTAVILVAFLASQTGSSYALWTSQLTINPGTITAGSIVASVEVVPATIDFSASQPANTVSVTFRNSGTVGANYTSAIETTGDALLLTHFTGQVWHTDSPQSCGDTPPADAAPFTPEFRGWLTAGAADHYCAQLVLDPALMTGDSSSNLDLVTSLELEGWTSSATARVVVTFRE